MKTHHVSQLYVKSHTTLVLTLLIFLIIESSFFFAAKGLSEPERYIHNFVDVPPYGNWSFVEKPMFPIYFNYTQIPVGSNWTVFCPLTANHTYHIYCYGEWIDYSSNPSTDYDIYVYSPLGELEGYHTESVGLPEHLGTTVNEPYFTPKCSGNYSFVIRNDPRESNASQPATLMIIESVGCNMWHEVFIKGKENNIPVLNTSWAFEFVTDSQHIEVLVKVPETLDMYEARLYLMANPRVNKGSILNNIPLAWEPGLYGERNAMLGGYNLESEGCRGVAYASCEFYGQDMVINFTSPYAGKSLYHLVFIGEVGSGALDFVVKTEFGNACLNPSIVPERVYPDYETAVAFVSNSTDLKNATFSFSTDCWKSVTALETEIVNNRTCSAVISGQAAGTLVNYRVEASDVLENNLVASGNYPVKYASTLNLSLVREVIYLGENVTVTGCLTPAAENLPITVHFTSANESKEMVCYTLANGTFTASFRPETLGTWEVMAKFTEDKLRYESVSPQLTLKVEEQSLLMKYSLYIGVGIGMIAIIGVVIYWRKSRG